MLTISDSAIQWFEFPNESDTSVDGDAAITEAALRQFTLHRLLEYGLEAGDALRLFELAGGGQSWKRSAQALASQLLERVVDPRLPRTERSQANLYARASALQRISQVMDTDNSVARQKLYTAATANFVRAHSGDSRYEHVVIDTVGGPVSAWVITPDTFGPHPIALVHGGVDGWSMDWENLALSLVAEGLTAVLIDGPGQGETRFTHRHFLTPGWLDSYEQICDFLVERAAGMPVTAVGNSMAGALVMLIASRYPVFSAVCSNGPVAVMAAQLARRSYARKLGTFCGDKPTEDEVQKAFESTELTAERITFTCSFLILQGDADPMVSIEDGNRVLNWVVAEDKQMALFAGGEHNIFRYPGDKQHLISTWLRDRIDRELALQQCTAIFT